MKDIRVPAWLTAGRPRALPLRRVAPVPPPRQRPRRAPVRVVVRAAGGRPAPSRLATTHRRLLRRVRRPRLPRRGAREGVPQGARPQGRAALGPGARPGRARRPRRLRSPGPRLRGRDHRLRAHPGPGGRCGRRGAPERHHARALGLRSRRGRAAAPDPADRAHRAGGLVRGLRGRVGGGGRLGAAAGRRGPRGLRARPPAPHPRGDLGSDRRRAGRRRPAAWPWSRSKTSSSARAARGRRSRGKRSSSGRSTCCARSTATCSRS